MANTNSQVFSFTGVITTFPEYTTVGTGTIETVGKDIIGTGTYFNGIEGCAILKLSGVPDDLTALTVMPISVMSNFPTSTASISLISGTVTAAGTLALTATAISADINTLTSTHGYTSLANGNSVYIWAVNGGAIGNMLSATCDALMTVETTAFIDGQLIPTMSLNPELRGQKWIFDGVSEVNKVDFVRDNTGAHLKDAFATDIPALTNLMVIEENHWHAIEILNAGANPGFVDGVSIPPGVTVPFNKASQDGFGSFNMIDPKVLDCSSTTFIVIAY